MKFLSYRKLGILLVLVVAVGALLVYRSRPVAVIVTVEGPAGTMITGTYAVDGEIHEIAAATPANFELVGRHVAFSILKDTQPGEISVKLAAGEAGSARTTGGPNETVECGFEKNWGLGGTMVWANLVSASGG